MATFHSLATSPHQRSAEHLRPHAQVRLKHSKEVVCLAMTDSLVAVGSQSHVSLVDPRRKAPVREVESLDHSHGAPAAARHRLE